MVTKIDLKALQQACPAAFYHPNEPAPEGWIIENGGMPGSKSRGDRPWFESDAQMRVSIGGNRAGKTTKLILEGGSFCMGMRPWYPPDSPWFTRGLQSTRMIAHQRKYGTPTPARIRYILPNISIHLPEVMAAIRFWWPDDWWKIVTEDYRGGVKEIQWLSGASWYFMSHHMAKRDFEGIESDLNLWDEPPPRDLWAGMERAVVSTGGRTVVGATLLDASGWFWDEVVVPAEADPCDDVLVTYHSIWDNTEENGGCPGQTAKSVNLWLTRKTTDPEERLAREHGYPMDVGGLVLSGYNRKIHKEEPFQLPTDCVIVSCIDPAGSKPFAGLHVAYTKNPPNSHTAWTGHIFDETWIPQSRNDLSLFCSVWQAKEAGVDEVCGFTHPNRSAIMLIDPFANEIQKADQMGRTMRQILAEDYQIQTEPATRTGKRARLLSLNDRFRRGYYRVWHNCRQFNLEAKRWSWDMKSAKLTSGPDDICDCLTYIDSINAPEMLMNCVDEVAPGIWVPDEYKDEEPSLTEAVFRVR
jgi:hypothetical protein